MTVIKSSVLGALLAGLACHSDPLSPRGPQLLVNSSALELRREGNYLRSEVPFTYTNRSRRTLALHGCNPPGPPDLEWWDGTEWRLTFQRVEMLMLCLSPPFLIAPGTTLTETLSIFVSDPIDPASGLHPVWLGPRQRAQYRLVWGLRDAKRETLVPLDQRVSNTFELNFPER